jgi:hypothetical protein
MHCPYLVLLLSVDDCPKRPPPASVVSIFALCHSRRVLFYLLFFFGGRGRRPFSLSSLTRNVSARLVPPPALAWRRRTP